MKTWICELKETDFNVRYGGRCSYCAEPVRFQSGRKTKAGKWMSRLHCTEHGLSWWAKNKPIVKESVSEHLATALARVTP